MPKSETFVDFYELLHLSPHADHAAIHLMHKHLTEKYHPDNKVTGDIQKHRAVLQAYMILSSPESRAQYDAEYREHIQPASSTSSQQDRAGSSQPEGGVEMERAKRLGILYLLYQKRVKDMAKPNMNMRDFETMLGYPKETLEFTLWYLKENDCLRAGDNGAYAISSKGVDFYERMAMENQDLVVLPAPGKLKALSPSR